jgi:polysaccharide chain length determinant protein (PEP-CTERM system associated)
MDIFANGFSPGMFLGMLRRRFWIAITLFGVVFSVVISLLVFLPNIYIARALILVEGQQIPVDYVRSTVTMGVERRLQSISQEILSRSRLEQIIEQYGLYRDLKEKKSSNELIVTTMRKDIGLQVTGKASEVGRSKAGTSDTVAFEVSYTYTDPEKTMQVANVLASFYIEENMKVRERQALGTAEFLGKQLEEVKIKLEERERQVSQYKQQYMGELPEQREANLKTIEVLQKQMEITSASLDTARQRQASLLDAQRSTAKIATTGTGTSETTEKDTVASLKAKLTQLKVRFSDKHPDVIRLTRAILVMEEEEQQEKQRELSQGATEVSAKAELTEITAEIQRLTGNLNKLHNDIAMYQRRVENAPKREQELRSISRDYEITKDLYESLLKRLGEANLADELEKNQKAERFRLLESAVYPKEPEAPDRVLLSFVALGLGLGVAIGGVLLWELLDTSFHSVDDLKRFTKVPILVTIPQIVTNTDRWKARFHQILRAATLVTVLFILVGTSYWVATGNEQLVRYLVSPTSGSQLRE